MFLCTQSFPEQFFWRERNPYKVVKDNFTAVIRLECVTQRKCFQFGLHSYAMKNRFLYMWQTTCSLNLMISATIKLITVLSKRFFKKEKFVLKRENSKTSPFDMLLDICMATSKYIAFEFVGPIPILGFDSGKFDIKPF